MPCPGSAVAWEVGAQGLYVLALDAQGNNEINHYVITFIIVFPSSLNMYNQRLHHLTNSLISKFLLGVPLLLSG